jgi:beta-glucanase (GH16 family)
MSGFKTSNLAYDDDLSDTGLDAKFLGIDNADNSTFGSPWSSSDGSSAVAGVQQNISSFNSTNAATTPQAPSSVASTSGVTASASLSAATTSASAASSASLAAPAGFTASDLIFNDSFSGASLNAANWNTYIASAASNGYPWYSTSSGGSGVGGVYEDEFDMPSQVSVSNGLTLDAVQQSITATNNLGSGTVTQTFPVTSGVVSTYGKLDFDGGYLQISMKEPGGDGSWPGLWLLPGAGAKSGDNFEIDIQEGGYTLGSANPNDVFAYHLHTSGGTFGGEVNTGIDLTAGFNTYAINWVPGVSITWYLNGAQIGEVTSAQAAIPNEPMELIMSNQVADSAASGWHTVLDSSTPQSMPMQIAGVQLYQGGGATQSAPTVTQVTATPSSGVELPGATIVFTMTMSAAVTVTGAPTLSLNDGGVATYTAGSGSTTLTFSYKVSSSDSDVAGLAITAVNLPNGAAISAGGVAANLANAPTTFPNLTIDPPSLSSIAFSPASADVSVGGTVTVTLAWNEAVTVTGGVPTLTLNDGGKATYTGGSGSKTLTFSYTVAAGQSTTALSATSLVANGATLVNSLGAAANLSLSGLAQTGPQIDGTAPTPTITSAGGAVSSQTQTISGALDTADAGLAVTVYDGTTPIGTAVSNSVTGAWSVGVSLAAGANSLTAQTVDASGQVGTSAAVGFNWVTTTVATNNPAQQSGVVNIVDTAAKITANISALKGQSNVASITIADTAANLQALTAAQIQSISGSKPTMLDALDQDPTFTSAQRAALGAAGISVEQPLGGGGVKLVSYTAAGLVKSAEYVGVTNPQYSSLAVNYGSTGNASNATYSSGMTATWSYNSNQTYSVAYAGVTGMPYASYTVQYGVNGSPTSATYSNKMTETWSYSSSVLSSVTFAGITGAPYTSYTVKYGTNGKPVSATYGNGMVETWIYNSNGTYSVSYSGVTGAQYTSYTVKFGTNGKPTSAIYSNGVTETWAYNSNGSYSVVFAGVTGQQYTYYTLKYGISGKPTSATYSNGMTETWSYNSNGSYSIAYSGVTGAQYTSYTVNYGANGKPTSAAFSNGMAETWTYDSDGSYKLGVTGLSGQGGSSNQILFDNTGANAATAQNMASGSGVLTLSENGLKVTSSSGSLGVTVGADTFAVNPHTTETINAAGENSETFAFGANFGNATISGLLATGTSHDLIQLDISSFSYLNTTMSQAQDLTAVLGHSQQVGANVAITDSALDKLTLDNVTLATLAANPSDFKFV